MKIKCDNPGEVPILMINAVKGTFGFADPKGKDCGVLGCGVLRLPRSTLSQRKGDLRPTESLGTGAPFWLIGDLIPHWALAAYC